MDNLKNKKFLERVLRFVDSILNLVNKLPKNIINVSLIKQIINSGTSVGANYHEACEAESSKDFTHKLKIAKKELRETRYWLRLLYKQNKEFKEEITCLGKESTELIKIFATIVTKFRS